MGVTEPTSEDTHQIAAALLYTYSVTRAARPQARTYIEFAHSKWNMNRLQLLPRNSSELPPVLMKKLA